MGEEDEADNEDNEDDEGYDGKKVFLPITPERMVRWRSVKSPQNRLAEGYLKMKKEMGLWCRFWRKWLNTILPTKNS